MILQVFVHIQSVQIFGVETGQQHIHHNGNVNFVFMRIICVGIFLVFNPLLYVLIIPIKIVDVMAGSILLVIFFDNPHQCLFLFVRLFFIVFFFLGKILLNLLNILISFCRWRKHTSDIQRHEFIVSSINAILLSFFEQVVILNGIVDRCSSQDSVVSPVVRHSIML